MDIFKYTLSFQCICTYKIREFLLVYTALSHRFYNKLVNQRTGKLCVGEGFIRQAVRLRWGKVYKVNCAIGKGVAGLIVRWGRVCRVNCATGKEVAGLAVRWG